MENLDPEIYPRLPPVYRVYRNTPIGKALIDILEELKSDRMVNDKNIELFLSQFDRAMTQHINDLPPENFSISVGSTVNFKFIYNYYHINLEPAVVEFNDRTFTCKSLEIFAMKGKQKESTK